MGQRPKELTPFASPWHYLGDRMREWRNQRRLSLGRLSKSVRYDPSYMARVERGEQRPSPELVSAYDRALGAGGALVRLHEEIIRGATVADLVSGHVANPGPHVANDPVALASDGGTHAPSFEGLTVPVRTNDGRIIFVALSRRTLLGALSAGAAVGAASEDSAAAERPSRESSLSSPNPIERLETTHRVLIDNDNLFGPHRAIPIAEQQIRVIKALRHERRGDDRAGLLRLHARYAELCGWLYQDIGNFHAAQHWIREALEVSQVAGDPDLTVFILARRSQLAGDMRDSVEAIDVAEAAEKLATPGSRFAAIAATFGAHGYALSGDASASQRAYDHAHQLREKVDHNPASTLGIWLDAAYIEIQRAHSLAALDDHHGAATGFRAAIQDLSATYHRDRGVYLAREAVAYARAREPDQAADIGLQALHIGIETGSNRITRELVQLEDRLKRWRKNPAVASFNEEMNEAVLHQT